MNTALKSFLIAALVYVALANAVFMWRNPTANSMSFYRDFVPIVTWQKMDGYQRDENIPTPD